MENFTQELIKEFILESNEYLDAFDQDILKLEAGDDSAELINRIFRAIHTIKGTGGCLGYQRLTRLSHSGENVLSLLRERKLTIQPTLITGMLDLSDALRKIFHSLETQGTEGELDHTELVHRLDLIHNPEPRPEIDPGFGLFSDDPVSEESAPPPSAVRPTFAVTAQRESAPPAPLSRGAVETIDLAGEKVIEATRISVADSAIRVDVAHMDKLMNLVGELVLARNQILQTRSRLSDPALQASSQQLDRVTAELQEGLMKMRMQPINTVWSKLPRIVRDLAQDLGKQVRLELHGGETELDRSLIEAIKDPLTHLVRNAIDHGIESVAERVRAGKDEEGILHLRAYHESGQVNVEIQDDGGGISADKVRDKALSMGLITPDQARQMTEPELQQLIFLPGFSTAAAVTNVSGRGVGMDVVRSHIERIGGSVDLQSNPGSGTLVKIKIPLTLAIIPALLIRSGGLRFAIPQLNLLELIRVEDQVNAPSIEMIYGAPVYRLRGQLLPLIYLNTLLQLPLSEPATTVNKIVVLQTDGPPFGLVVDQIEQTEEIVVKPLARLLQNLTQFAGATILGDGRVALILDVLALAPKTLSNRLEVERLALTAKGEQTLQETQRWLLFRVTRNHHLALPLEQVQRLEDFNASALQGSPEHPVIPYRDEIIPLLSLAHLLHYTTTPFQLTDSVVPTVIFPVAGHTYGLIVDKIEDIVAQNITWQESNARPGIIGSAVIRGRVTELIDVPRLLALHRLDQDFFSTLPAPSNAPAPIATHPFPETAAPATTP
jgi:two-component system, chemotaxis family, sensor kinase CheA